MTPFRSIVSLLLLFTLLVAGCNGKPSDLIEEETYISLLVEFELIHTLHEARGDTEDTIRFRKMVMDEYGVTEEQFRRSHAWYEQEIREQLERYRTALDRLNEEFGKMSAAKRELEEKKQQELENEEDETGIQD